MTVGSSRAGRLFDEGQNTNTMAGVLRSPDIGADHVSSIGHGILLPLPLANGSLHVSVSVTSVKVSAGDETYTIALYADDVTAPAPVKIVSFPVAARGSYSFSLDLDSVRGLGFSKPAVMIGHELSGTEPTLDYSAWITEQSPN